MFEVLVTIIGIVLAIPLLTKLMIRTVWFLFPYGRFSFWLRSHVIAQYVAVRLLGRQFPEDVTAIKGRTYVRVPATFLVGLVWDEFWEEHFCELADGIASCGDYSKGAAHLDDEYLIFQFWPAS